MLAPSLFSFPLGRHRATGTHRTLATTFALIAILTGVVGCSGKNWPTPVGARSSAMAVLPTRIDIMPIEIAVYDKRGFLGFSSEASARAQQLATEFLWQQGVTTRTIVTHRDQAGALIGSSAVEGAESMPYLSSQDYAKLTVLLASFGFTGDAYTLPRYDIPALRSQTGTQATLYVGGYSFHGPRPSKSKFQKVAKGVLITLVVVAAVVLVVVVVAKVSGSGGGGGKGGGGSARPIAPPMNGGANVRVIGSAAEVAGRSSGGGVPPIFRFAKGALRVGSRVVGTTARVALESLQYADAVWIQEPTPLTGPPQETPKSTYLYLQLSLVDNATGTLLWHASEVFPTKESSKKSFDKAVRGMLQTVQGTPYLMTNNGGR